MFSHVFIKKGMIRGYLINKCILLFRVRTITNISNITANIERATIRTFFALLFAIVPLFLSWA